MSKRRWVVGFSIVFWILVECGQALAQRDGMPVGYPQSLESDLQLLLGRLRGGSPSPQLLVQVSSTYFDLADDLLTDEASRRAAYEAGAKAARRAFELDESNADAHFFHAANLGSAERLRGIANAAVVLKDVKDCAMRAIELNPEHAQALHIFFFLILEVRCFVLVFVI